MGMTPDPGMGTGTDGTEGTEKDAPKQTPPKRDRNPKRTARRDKLGKVENRLNEMFATIAVGQTGLGVMSGDPRHIAGGEVTSALAPSLVAAWCNLARENPRVEAVLLRMSETSAWGEVILATGGFVYSQAQVYGAVPATMPNPWVQVPVPPSPDVAAAHTNPPTPDWTPPVASPPAAADENGRIVGRQPPGDPDPEVVSEAERQRKIAEEQRLRMRGN